MLFRSPFGAAYWQDVFRIRVFGVVNVGLLFALSEFVMAWVVAFVYSRIANREFDRLAAEIGWTKVATERASLRRQGGKPVPGVLFLFRKG